MANATRGPRRRQLPHTEELKAWREFIETIEALRSEIASRLLAETSLSAGDYSVLLALREAPGHRMRSSELAARLTGSESVPRAADTHVRRCPSKNATRSANARRE